MRQKEEKPTKGPGWWFYRGITDTSVALAEDLPGVVQPVVRIVALLTLSVLTVLMVPWFAFRRFFPTKYTEILFQKQGPI
ncbi:MAG: hypothetical protein RRA15_09055 [bacterium]|nr:hypothetical protein [bacterium]MDT8366630.1 hypothetical protein [bacterium]